MSDDRDDELAKYVNMFDSEDEAEEIPAEVRGALRDIQKASSVHSEVTLSNPANPHGTWNQALKQGGNSLSIKQMESLRERLKKAEEAAKNRPKKGR